MTCRATSVIPRPGSNPGPTFGIERSWSRSLGGGGMRPEIVVGSGHSEVGPNGPRQAAPGQATTSLARAAAAGRSGGVGGQQGDAGDVAHFFVLHGLVRRSGFHRRAPLEGRNSLSKRGRTKCADLNIIAHPKILSIPLKRVEIYAVYTGRSCVHTGCA